VGIGALSPKTRTRAVTIGLMLSIAIWIIGQDLGQLYSGQATDPNSAPLIALMAVALLARFRKVVPVRGESISASGESISATTTGPA
jgi:hypothetical protein